MRNSLVSVFSEWFRRNFASPDAVSLFFTIVLLLLVLEFFGGILLPILISVGIAYLLLGLQRCFQKLKLPRLLAMSLAYVVFIAVIVFILLSVLPMLWKQFVNMSKEFPSWITQGQAWLTSFSHQHPTLLNTKDLAQWIALLKQHAAGLGKTVLSYSFSAIPNIIEIVLYLILVPIMVFFFLRDAHTVTEWFSQFLPNHRSLMQKVWGEVNAQIANYIRGRIIEILLVGAVSMLAFRFLNLPYAALLGALVGLSVIVPYVGAVIVTIPIVVLGLMQWGFAAHFWYLIITYTVIIILDANVLVPLLFSEAMDLHPVAIIVSVLIFGGVWGFWGVFFAIPLATLVKAVMHYWPRDGVEG